MNRSRGSRLRKFSAVRLLALTGVAATGLLLPAQGFAQAQSSAQAATYDFDIPAQSLSVSLNQVAARANIQVLYSGDDTRGINVSALSGRMTVDEAMGRLLSGTGYTYRYMQPGVITLQRASAQGNDGERVLGAVRVEGAQGYGLPGATSVNGVNGSRDVTATEGTRSYTSNALTIGSKMAESIKDVPMSVSVLTRQQMTDQNVTDFRTAMERLPGVISNLGTSSNNTPSFYSRGFEITTVQIDGGAGLTYKSQYANKQYYQPIMDMSLYDHVEIVRGAEGTFTGYGNPGGVVNLVRKKPLDHAQLLIEGQLGSYNMHRVSVDLTGPLAFGGALRGRLIATHQDNDFFYDVVHNNQNIIAGTLELDVTPTTLLSVGATHTQQKAGLWYSGLMRRVDGTSPDYPRSTCLCVPWANTNTQNNEIFGQIEQKLGSDWTLKFKSTYQRQTADNRGVNIFGGTTPGVDPWGQFGTTYLTTPQIGYSKTRSWLNEFTVDGSFRLFGQVQKITVGGNYSQTNPSGSITYNLNGFYSPYPGALHVDPTSFNPYNPAYAFPGIQGPSVEILDDTFTNMTAFARVNLEPLPRLHLITSVNYTRFVYRQNELLYCPPFWVSFNLGGCVVPYEPIPNTNEFGQHKRITGSDVSWPPRVSLSYDLRKNLSIYATYADIYLDQSAFFTREGNPLTPVRGVNFEGGAKWAPNDAKLNVTLSGYYIRQQNFAQQFCHTQAQANAPGWVDNGSGICTSSPTGGTTQNLVNPGECCFIQNPNRKNISYGVDFEISGELARNWQVAASYTFNRNFYSPKRSDGVGGVDYLLSFSPPQLFKIWTSYAFLEGSALRGLTVNMGVQGQTMTRVVDGYCSKPQDLDGDGYMDCDYENDYKIAYFSDPGHVIASLGGSYRFNENVLIQLNIENLFDKKYFATVGGIASGNWYGSPRNVAVTLRGKW
jgi:outer-membrane receptor for ferric coprogen and ferric-rhodotorulic acid